MKNSFLIRLFLASLLVWFLCFPVHAQQTVEKVIIETRYLLALPEHYNNDTVKRWPLLIFLHGSGESGSDIEKVKAHGPPELVEKGKKFPFIVVSPQSDVPSGWDADNLFKLLQELKKKYRVDNNRIYLTGLSMGGFGTIAVAMKYPQEFAAIAPVCGGGDTASAWKLRNIPAWYFHGAKDDVVLPAGSINLVNESKKYNAPVLLTLYPEANHNSWDSTYNNNDKLYEWFLTKTKFNYKEVPVDISSLNKYTGRFAGPDGDTVQITNTKNGLVAKPGNQSIVLKAAGQNLFFLQPERHMDIRFSEDKKNVTGFLFLGDRKLFYRKIK